METSKLTSEEIQELQKIRENGVNLLDAYGKIEYQIQILNLAKQDLNDNLKNQQQTEVDFGKKLQEKYGEISLNPETGEFTRL